MDAQTQTEHEQEEEMEEEIMRNPENSTDHHQSQGLSPESVTAKEIFDFKEEDVLEMRILHGIPFGTPLSVVKSELEKKHSIQVVEISRLKSK